MKKLNKQNGITLIALIITIIVMLILVGVTINVALNGGLFEKAKTASDKTQREADKEYLLSLITGTLDNTGNLQITTTKLTQDDWTAEETTNNDYLKCTSPKSEVFYVNKETGSVLDTLPEAQTNLWKQWGLTSENVKYGVRYTATGGAPEGLSYFQIDSENGCVIAEGNSMTKAALDNMFNHFKIGTNYIALASERSGQVIVFNTDAGATIYQGEYSGEFDLETFINTTSDDEIYYYVVAQ